MNTRTDAALPAAPKLSIIVPALNEAGTLDMLLADLQPLRAARHEVILADGGSRDGTPTRAAPAVDRVIAAPRGRARQMNAGADAATGAVLWFVHADTRLPPRPEQHIAAALQRAQWGWFEVRLSGRQPLLRVVERSMNLRSRLSCIATGDQGLFVTTALFRQLGGFADIPLMEDIELSARLKRTGRPVSIRTPLVTSSRRWEEGGILRTIALMWRLRLAYALGADPARLARAYR